MSERAPELPRTLTFRDLLLFKLVAIVNVDLLTPSASLGRPALWLWLAAFALFFVPEVVAVLTLAKRYPEEGGILRVGGTGGSARRNGFVSGWCSWAGQPLLLPHAAGLPGRRAGVPRRGSASALVASRRSWPRWPWPGWRS